jgi:hypothetical protein
MKDLRYFRRIMTLALVAGLVVTQIACDDDDPAKEDTPETITQVTLTFTPVGSDAPVETVTATDPDGLGPQELKVDQPIDLKINTTYRLSINLINGLLDPTEPEYNVTDEVEEEGDEHQFFFSWSAGVFSSPTGTGNIGTSGGAVNYTGADDSVDENGLPLGLTTTWTTAATTAADKSFTILLMHQPDLKSSTSTSADGEEDVNLTFTLNVAN